MWMGAGQGGRCELRSGRGGVEGRSGGGGDKGERGREDNRAGVWGAKGVNRMMQGGVRWGAGREVGGRREEGD